MSKKEVYILGIRGIPAEHGGFETFAEILALYLVENGWEVTVFCQTEEHKTGYQDEFKGVKRFFINAKDSSLGTIFFDFKSVYYSLKNRKVCLTLGYNTAIFNILHRIWGFKNVINMDGIEWKRSKWSRPIKAWFYVNERIAGWVGNELIADHPEIKNYLATKYREDKITMIPYGGYLNKDSDATLISKYSVEPNNYLTVIARPEPENSFFEIVAAFSAKPRGVKLLVFGKFTDDNPYHVKVKGIASDEVIFAGVEYDKPTLQALRTHSRYYIHGHQVGGTNPSLVEALSMHNAIIAHDNKFNRWVASGAALYFSNVEELTQIFDENLDNSAQIASLKNHAKNQDETYFQWQSILQDYESVLLKQMKI